MGDCYKSGCRAKDCLECEDPNKKISKELMACSCGSKKNEIYADMTGIKITGIYMKCPKCGKESLIANLHPTSILDLMDSDE